LDLDTTGAPAANPSSTPTDAPNLDEMLNSLGDEDRALVIMKYSQDHSYQELSQIFGLSESACKMRVSRAVGRLRERHGG
ncbi:MAG: sigma-70 family RNA polymerase sigma factor, partial [Planctomycetota bacterium]|nr:sigma-70 family RNA polymerase sigma factor [Planctomycetota bacterium]